MLCYYTVKNRGELDASYAYCVADRADCGAYRDTAERPDIRRTKASLVDYAVGNLILKRNPAPGMVCCIVQTEKEVVYKL